MLEKLGIKSIRIPLPFRLNHVNCFLAEGEHGYTMIDTGLHDDTTRRIWQNELKDKQVAEIILTHLHPDHSGYAGKLQEMTGATIKMTEIDAHDLKEIWCQENISKFVLDFNRAATPPEIISGIEKIREKMIPKVNPPAHINEYLVDGQEIMLGSVPFEVLTVPGHAAGLVCFYQKEQNLLLSTDHILPKITPNIAYWFYGDKNPLQSYQNSLKKIRDLDVEYVVPSHGEPFQDANKRIDEIWSHHEERLKVAMAAVGSGADVLTVCEKLFRRVLSVYEYQFAIGETIAHLEYLRAKGELERELVDGKWQYSRI